MEEADAEMEVARETQERNNQKILEIVSTHLGEDVKYLPYLPKSTASSSNSILLLSRIVTRSFGMTCTSCPILP
jgi:hypothetical protein